MKDQDTHCVVSNRDVNLETHSLSFIDTVIMTYYTVRYRISNTHRP